MHRNLGDIQLAPERLAWRALMRSLCDASVVHHNDPYPSEIAAMHPLDVEAEIQSYEEDVALLQTLIQRRRYATAALRRRPVPYEILCRIFSECRRVDPWAPATLSHVCRLWRHVAIGHRALWTRIELGRRETSLTRASEWARRSGNFPLELGIRCSEHVSRGDITPWLQENSGAIKSLAILHMAQRTANRLLPSLPSFSHLESLRILGLEEFDLDMRWIARLLGGSPALTSLSLSGVSTLLYPESLTGVASQLTHLSIGVLSHIDYQFPLQANAVLEIISTCPSLRSLECHSLSEQVIEPPVVSLPLLSSLTIGDGPETCVILKYLRIPKLLSLRLVCGQILDENEEYVESPGMDDNRQDYVEFFVECLGELHKNCSPKITTVIWERTAVDVGALKNCTEYLRDMQQLECRGLSKIGMESLSGFLSTDIEGFTCPYPQLRSIIFTQCTIGRLGFASETTVTAHSSKTFPTLPTKNPVVAENCRCAVDGCQSRLSDGDRGLPPRTGNE